MCIAVAWIRNCGLLKTTRVINTRTRRTVGILQARWFSAVSHLMIFWLKVSIDFVRKHSSLSKWAMWKKSRDRGVRESKCRHLCCLNRNFNLVKPPWLFFFLPLCSAQFRVRKMAVCSFSFQWYQISERKKKIVVFVSPGLLSRYSWSKSCMKMTMSTEQWWNDLTGINWRTWRKSYPSAIYCTTIPNAMVRDRIRTSFVPHR